MGKHERLRYEMFVRVRQFGKAHDHEFPAASPGGKAFAAVAAAAKEMESHATAKVLTAKEGRQAKVALRKAIRERMMAVARTARLVARTVPGADSVFQLPQQQTDVALLAAARAFIRESQAALERFGPLGLRETFITDLPALVSRFEQADQGRQAGKTGVAAAQAGITSAVTQGMEAIRTLDVVISNTFAGNPVVLAAWKRARQASSKVKSPSVVPPTSTSAPAAPEQPAETSTPAASGPAPLALLPDPIKRAS